MSKEIDKLAWLLVHDGKLLVARSHNKSLFYLPGGKRESGESDQQALSREVNEELSVNLISNSIDYAGTFSAVADGQREPATVKLTCYFAKFAGELKASAEIAEIKWLTYQDKALCSEGAIQVLEWLKKKGLI
ncbi:NUDIX domain-containing protein [Psychromonas sp. 14N.309.X.WAT.B.A12]|uniref:NUDIX hydrolase n=1 Tax=unclassified Psychromonas TaxID=2614957 RepID=UPI0025AFC66E|nr:NUDIX domain-containing protein [Psychromonas sp. 14N.309.X.WAT.B.A12]MDN2663571.1 NUDIX domain-containing protein [Psychromonas sp. 14N.309.X.WAT.B.A12]